MEMDMDMDVDVDMDMTTEMDMDMNTEMDMDMVKWLLVLFVSTVHTRLLLLQYHGPVRSIRSLQTTTPAHGRLLPSHSSLPAPNPRLARHAVKVPSPVLYKKSLFPEPPKLALPSVRGLFNVSVCERPSPTLLPMCSTGSILSNAGMMRDSMKIPMAE